MSSSPRSLQPVATILSKNWGRYGKSAIDTIGVEAAGFELGELEALIDSMPADEAEAGPEADREIPSLYSVVIECGDEDEQRTVYDAAIAEGRKCRLMVV